MHREGSDLHLRLWFITSSYEGIVQLHVCLLSHFAAYQFWFAEYAALRTCKKKESEIYWPREAYKDTAQPKWMFNDKYIEE